MIKYLKKGGKAFMTLRKGEIIVYLTLMLSIIMVNPPILILVNNFSKGKPLLWNYPTLWLWLQLWYGIAIIAFLVGAIAIKSWKKEYRR
jgi:hypothetical protein